MVLPVRAYDDCEPRNGRQRTLPGSTWQVGVAFAFRFVCGGFASSTSCDPLIGDNYVSASCYPNRAGRTTQPRHHHPRHNPRQFPRAEAQVQ
eukprot:7388914-Prymnesium_polylepis.2